MCKNSQTVVSVQQRPDVYIRKNKKSVSKFIDDLEYNNQIQSSYDLTLLDRQKNHDQNNAA